MVRKVSSIYGALAWAGGLLLLVAVLSWAIPRLALGQVFPAAPSFFNLFRQRPPTAGAIIPSAEDLGEGWLLTAEKSDMEGSYYFDIDSNGYPLIGTHVSNTEPPFDTELIETVSMRGYAHPEQRWNLFGVVFVFKDTAEAETMAKEFLSNVGNDKGRVLVLVLTWAPGAGLSHGESQATALSEAQMLEIGRMIETRIP